MPSSETDIGGGLFIALPDGRKMSYSQYGSSSPHADPLLYFHGGMSCNLDIAFAAGRCKERNIKIIAPDRPGIGLSDCMPKRSEYRYSDDIDFLLSHLDHDSIALLGWSLGSSYVFSCLEKIACRFSIVATIGSCASFSDEKSIEELGLFLDRMVLRWPKSLRPMLKILLSAASKLPPSLLKQELEKELTGSRSDREIVNMIPADELAGFIRQGSLRGVDGIIDDYWRTRSSAHPRLENIEKEIIMIHGQDDSIVPISIAYRLLENLPKARLIELPDAGHFLLRKNLDLVLDTLFPRNN